MLSACRRVRDSWVIPTQGGTQEGARGKQSRLPGGRGARAGEAGGALSPSLKAPSLTGPYTNLTPACQPAQREAGPADGAAMSSAPVTAWGEGRENRSCS